MYQSGSSLQMDIYSFMSFPFECTKNQCTLTLTASDLKEKKMSDFRLRKQKKEQIGKHYDIFNRPKKRPNSREAVFDDGARKYVFLLEWLIL